MVVKRLDVYLVSLDPTKGSEIKKTRPCVILSPDEMNRTINTVIVAPMTSQGNNYPTRILCQFKNIRGQIILDQIRTIDKKRLKKRLGKLDKETGLLTLYTLQELFAP
jgi:mRNA interferase MazF